MNAQNPVSRCYVYVDTHNEWCNTSKSFLKTGKETDDDVSFESNNITYSSSIS